jgi:hypothetical protein
MINSGEAANTNFMVFGLTWSGLEPTIYRTRGEYAYRCGEMQEIQEGCPHRTKLKIW